MAPEPSQVRGLTHPALGRLVHFWARQFSVESTPRQRGFDCVFGVAAPIVCLAGDPIVFRGDGLIGPSELSRYRVFFYAFFVAQIAVLALWLRFPARGMLAAVCAGFLGCGALAAFALGVYLAPLSVMGLVLLIGFLGFTPFVTAFVYLRNTIRGLRRSCQGRRITAPVALSLCVTLMTLSSITWGMDRVTRLVTDAVQDFSEGDEGAQQRVLQSLRRLGPIAIDEMVWQHRAGDTLKRAWLAQIYLELTGEEITARRDAFAD